MIKRKYIAAGLTTLLIGGVAGGFAGANVAMAESETAQKFDDVALLTKIKADLLKSGSVDGLDVNVDVKDGNVTLSGWASDATERSRAGELAGQIEGVKSVENRIQIKEK